MKTKKVKTIALWVVQILLAGLFVMQAAMKLSGMPGWVERFSNWGYPANFYLLIGVLEGLGALGLLIPKLSGYSAGILFVVMVGATITHLSHGEPAIATIVIGALLVIIMFLRRPALIERWVKSRPEYSDQT